MTTLSAEMNSLPSPLRERCNALLAAVEFARASNTHMATEEVLGVANQFFGFLTGVHASPAALATTIDPEWVKAQLILPRL